MAEVPPSNGEKPSFAPVRKLPDASLCRVRKSCGKYYECLVSAPESCRYALSFGTSFFCLSPLAHTKVGAPKPSDAASGEDEKDSL